MAAITQGQQAHRPAHFRLVLDDGQKGLQLLGQPVTDLRVHVAEQFVEQLLLILLGPAGPLRHQAHRGDQHQAQRERARRRL